MTPAKQQRKPWASEWLRDLRARTLAFVGRQPVTNAIAQTPAYIDLVFAYGHGRVDSAAESNRLLEQAHAVLEGQDEIHTALLDAFAYRIGQTLARQPTDKPLPLECPNFFQTLDRLSRHFVDRVRKVSRILEPNHRVNPYGGWGERINEFERQLEELRAETNRETFARRFAQLLTEAEKSSRSRHKMTSRVLTIALNSAVVAGDELTIEVLQRSQAWLAETQPVNQDPWGVGELLASALRAGRLVKNADVVRQLAEMVQQQIESNVPDDKPTEGNKPHPAMYLAPSLAEAVRALFELNLCDEADQFLYQTGAILLTPPPDTWDFSREHAVLRFRLALSLCQGWCAFGWQQLADPILSLARRLLADSRRDWRTQCSLACPAIEAVRLAPRSVAEGYFNLLLEQMQGIRDTFTTASHLSTAQLEVAETLVLSVTEIASRDEAPS